MRRYAYEWEQKRPVDVEGHIERLGKEIYRIENVTLKANWGEDLEGREVWVKKLAEKKGQLKAFQEMS